MLSYYLLLIDSDEDKQKFEQLYDQYNDLLFYIARRFFCGQQDVEDVVQDAYLALVNNLDKIGEVYSSQTKHYIITVIERKSLDVLRKRKGAVPMEWDETTPGLTVELPEERGLADALSKLSAGYREVLMLKYFNGYTVKEIAGILSVTPKAAESMLGRAKAALQDALDKAGIPI